MVLNFGGATMTTAPLDRLTYQFHIVETGNDSFRFKADAAAKKEERNILTLTSI